jgi:hypothetical protein
VLVGDYLAEDIEGVDVIVTNPPFGIAEAVTRKALREADWVAVLVRQGFVGHERATWMRDDMPDSYELPDRPSFAASVKCLGSSETLFIDKKRKSVSRGDACGWSVMQQLDAERPTSCPVCRGRVRVSTSDACDYTWLVWTPERNRMSGKRVILPATPLAERRTVRAA